jgi:hypothetical protein
MKYVELAGETKDGKVVTCDIKERHEKRLGCIVRNIKVYDEDRNLLCISVALTESFEDVYNMGVEWLARYVHRPTIHIETEVEI